MDGIKLKFRISERKSNGWLFAATAYLRVVREKKRGKRGRGGGGSLVIAAVIQGSSPSVFVELRVRGEGREKGKKGKKTITRGVDNAPRRRSKCPLAPGGGKGGGKKKKEYC